ncbi:hypothetical protein B4098_3170 [Heyndrickxia coagulans]|uniref:Uncharacterized protein n=1 Tax=Heyndrickxia coagulans TaxID=1398 RepID=A0A150K4S6_HEYCO|nr:hypothetical protein B4098_3170 [Heyndrickxia coagulans]
MSDWIKNMLSPAAGRKGPPQPALYCGKRKNRVFEQEE